MRNIKTPVGGALLTAALGAMLFAPHAAFAATKELAVNLSHECNNAMFYVTCAKDTKHEYAYNLIAPDGSQTYQMTMGEDGTATCFLNSAAEGTWTVSVSDGDVTNEDVNGSIGELNVSVKENVGSSDTVDSDDKSDVNVEKQLASLSMYLRDDSIVISWTDDTVGSVNVEVTDTKTQQKYYNGQVSDAKTVTVDFPSGTKQITVTLTPSVAGYDSQSSQSYTIDVDNYPDATITFNGTDNTNEAKLNFHAVLNGTYTLNYEDNGKKVGTSGSLDAGEYDLSVPLVEGENDVSVFVVDADGDMRSTSYTTNLDTTAPVLQIKTNYDGGTTTSDSVTFEGSVSGCDKLTVNNEEVTPDYDGAFSYTASLKVGENRFQIAASDKAGNISTYEATITRIEEQKNSSAIVSASKIRFIALILCVGLGLFLFFKYQSSKKNNDDGSNHGRDSKSSSGASSSVKKSELSDEGQKLQKEDMIHTILSIVIPLAIVLFVFRVCLIISIVQSGSMEPTIMAGDFTMANALAYKNSDPQRGDIIFLRGEQTNGEIYLKRIIGMPGDHIEFHDGYVYINDQLVKEDYISDDVQTNCNKTFDVPDGCYFVMGDNRENSEDARYWDNPYITRNEILGKVVVSFTIPGNRKVSTVETPGIVGASGDGATVQSETDTSSTEAGISESADEGSTEAASVDTTENAPEAVSIMSTEEETEAFPVSISQ